MRFESDYLGLLLQDEEGVWAHFENGEFETTDKAVIERLKKVEYVRVAGKSGNKGD